MTESIIRLGLVEDRLLMREVLASRIRQDSSFRLMYACGSDSILQQPAKTQRPDLLLLCAEYQESLEDRRWVAMIRQIRSQSPGTKVIVSSIERNDEQIVTFFEAGAAGFVSSDSSWEELGVSLRQVFEGRPLCPQHVIASVLARLRDLLQVSETQNTSHEMLSDRESDVVRLVAEGCSNNEIAVSLGISVSTTKNHVHSIRKKLGIHRRRELLGFC